MSELGKKRSQAVIAVSIYRAKELLKTAHNAALATVNPDGSPHNSPVFFALDDSLEHFYWSSSQEAQHSKNIERTGQGLVAVFEADKGGGLFLKLENAGKTDPNTASVAIFNQRCAAIGKPEVPHTHFTSGRQTLYRGDITVFWVNISEHNQQGNVVRDYRHQIDRTDLLH